MNPPSLSYGVHYAGVSIRTGPEGPVNLRVPVYDPPSEAVSIRTGPEGPVNLRVPVYDPPSEEVSIRTGPEGPVNRAHPGRGRAGYSRFNPHRPRRAGEPDQPLRLALQCPSFNPHRPRRAGEPRTTDRV